MGNGEMRKLEEALDYVLARVVEVEAMCARVAKLRTAVEGARAELGELEARGEEPDLVELQAILERVARAQDEWDEFASRLARTRGGSERLH